MKKEMGGRSALGGGRSRAAPLWRNPARHQHHFDALGTLADCSGSAPASLRTEQGAALSHARLRKHRTYPEFANSCRCRLLVLAVELGARWMPVEL